MPQIDATQTARLFGGTKIRRNDLQQMVDQSEVITIRRTITTQITDFPYSAFTPVYTDLAIGASNNLTVTSAGNPFVTNDGEYVAGYGKVVQVTNGTGFTQGFYNVVSVSSGIATLDRPVGTTSSTAGLGYAYYMGMWYDVASFSEAWIEIISTGVTPGSGAGLQVLIQALSLKNNQWFNFPTSPTLPANPIIAGLAVPAGNSVISCIILPAPMGDIIRVGFANTADYTAGSFSAILKVKG